jgi:hypothetical protein
MCTETTVVWICDYVLAKKKEYVIMCVSVSGCQVVTSKWLVISVFILARMT